VLLRALQHLSRYFDDGCYINFSGGEPLLAFDRIKSAVETLDNLKASQKNNWRYSLTTNGCLIDSKILDYLNDHRFHLILSFDGYTQDDNRKPGSFNSIVKTIRSIQKNPNITLETNTVCIPDSVKDLARSFQLIAELGVPEILLSFSNMHPWNKRSLEKLKIELKSLRHYFLNLYERCDTIPFKNFRKTLTSGRFYCEGGKNRMALAQDGTLWGCYLFPDFFKQSDAPENAKNYSFGKVDDFLNNLEEQYPKILSNYAHLRGDRFLSDETICALCPDVEVCTICPISAAFHSGLIGKIPDWMCSLRRIIRQERNLFLNEIET
jgi:sulfatase maturation enzyme AslB (radical SAM superfamily)